MGRSSNITPQMRREASQWVALIESEAADGNVVADLELWLGADPRHRTAFEDASELYGDLEDAPFLSAYDVDAAIERQRTKPRTPLFARLGLSSGFRAPLATGAAMAACVIMAGVFFVSDWSPSEAPIEIAQIEPPIIETEIAEMREVTLEDGSVVTLGAKSSIETDFTGELRTVSLIEGEAFFDVTSDPSRPFIVETDNATVRVLGTQFDVRQGAGEVSVAVLEGIVEVIERLPELTDAPQSNNPEPDPQRLIAGQKAVIRAAAEAPVEVSDISPSAAGAWRTGRLIYRDAPLSEVILDANRYSETPIVFSEAELGELRVLGAFRSDQIDDMLAALELSHPVRINRSSGTEIRIETR